MPVVGGFCCFLQKTSRKTATVGFFKKLILEKTGKTG